METLSAETGVVKPAAKLPAAVRRWWQSPRVKDQIEPTPEEAIRITRRNFIVLGAPSLTLTIACGVIYKLTNS